jgi:hypothetical protein
MGQAHLVAQRNLPSLSPLHLCCAGRRGPLLLPRATPRDDLAAIRKVTTSSPCDGILVYAIARLGNTGRRNRASLSWPLGPARLPPAHGVPEIPLAKAAAPSTILVTTLADLPPSPVGGGHLPKQMGDYAGALGAYGGPGAVPTQRQSKDGKNACRCLKRCITATRC